MSDPAASIDSSAASTAAASEPVECFSFIDRGETYLHVELPDRCVAQFLCAHHPDGDTTVSAGNFTVSWTRLGQSDEVVAAVKAYADGARALARSGLLDLVADGADGVTVLPDELAARLVAAGWVDRSDRAPVAGHCPHCGADGYLGDPRVLRWRRQAAVFSPAATLS